MQGRHDGIRSMMIGGWSKRHSVQESANDRPPSSIYQPSDSLIENDHYPDDCCGPEKSHKYLHQCFHSVGVYLAQRMKADTTVSFSELYANAFRGRFTRCVGSLPLLVEKFE